MAQDLSFYGLNLRTKIWNALPLPSDIKTHKVQPFHHCSTGRGGGLNLQPNFQKGGETDRTSNFTGGGARKEEGDFFQGGGCNFHKKVIKI